MIQRFSDDLSMQEIFANGDELANIMGIDKDENGDRVYSHPKEKEKHVHTFKNPVLVTDNYQISKLDSTLRDTLFALFGMSTKITEYDSTSLEFDQQKYKGVWGPSIDTLLLCKALKNLDIKDVKKAIEVGSGSGFISKYTINKTPNLESMTLIDMNRYAFDSAADNIKDKRAEFFIGNGITFLEGKKYDLLICNPPYIPRPKSIDDNPYEGTQLLNYLIKNLHTLLTPNGSFITNISSLCEDIVAKTIQETGVQTRVLESMHVPLKVYNVLNNPEWMDYLLNKNGLKEDNHKSYRFWQRIDIVEIRPN